MTTSAANEDRIFARCMAQELTGDEIATVAGGDPQGEICWYCDWSSGKDEKLLGIDPE